MPSQNEKVKEFSNNAYFHNAIKTGIKKKEVRKKRLEQKVLKLLARGGIERRRVKIRKKKKVKKRKKLNRFFFPLTSKLYQKLGNVKK